MKLFGYLKSVTGRRESIFISPEDIEDISGNGANVKDWLEKYPDASEDIDKGLLEPRERSISNFV